MRTNLLFLFIFNIFAVAEAQILFVPNADFPTILAAVDKARVTPAHELRGEGPIGFQVIHQIIMQNPNPREFPFIGYGENEDEAKDRAGLLCLKYQLEYQDSALEKKIDQQMDVLQAMSPQNFVDHLTAFGAMVGQDPSSRARPKNWNQTVRCKNMAASFRMIVMHARCASTGFQPVTGPQVDFVEMPPRKSREHRSDNRVELFAALAASAECAGKD